MEKCGQIWFCVDRARHSSKLYPLHLSVASESCDYLPFVYSSCEALHAPCSLARVTFFQIRHVVTKNQEPPEIYQYFWHWQKTTSIVKRTPFKASKKSEDSNLAVGFSTSSATE
ncbi:hypothetical protein GCK32_000503 [Trichostrongylus colubriformis]|uniref:Uncharacterized protein n=1 Tax=Trichostrongylus colubriformis TaxID=6319 RepID=A0AAN8IJS8_TRICO